MSVACNWFMCIAYFFAFDYSTAYSRAGVANKTLTQNLNLIKLFMILKNRIVWNVLDYLLSTWSWALLLAFPQVNSITPVMSIEVCFRFSLCTAPVFSTRMQELDCKHFPFRVHSGTLTTGTETSHSKQAPLGAVTSTSTSSLTTDRGWAESRHNTQGTFFT